MTGVEVVIGNCLLKVHKILPDFRNWEEKFQIMIEDASCHLPCYTSTQWTHASILPHYGDIIPKNNGITTFNFWCHVTSSVTWPFDSRWATSYRWSIVTMRLSRTVMELWCLKDNGVTTLTFWSHVTSSITWPFDLQWMTSYGWYIVTICVSSTIIKIQPFEVLHWLVNRHSSSLC